MRKARQRFLPHMAFTKCSVLRGHFGSRAPVLAQGGHSYVLFWRKNDPPKFLYILDAQSHMQFLHTFQPAQWTIIHFWSNSESSGRKQISPPPGLPVPETFSGQGPLDMTIDQVDELPTPSPDTADAHMPDAPT